MAKKRRIRLGLGSKAMRRVRRNRADSSPSIKISAVRRPHAVIAGMGQWGQQAAAHLLNRVIFAGGRITVIVQRQYANHFETAKPSLKEWADCGSVKEKLDKLRESG